MKKKGGNKSGDRAGKRHGLSKEERQKKFLSFNLGAQKRYMEEQREQKIAKAYKRQRREEAEREAKRPRPADASTEDARKKFYDSVFAGEADDDSLLDDLYGKKLSKAASARPSKTKTPATEPSEDEEDDGQEDVKNTKKTGGVVHSKASKAWRAEEKRRAAEQKAARERKLEREKKEKQRRMEHKMLSKRTRKGQPVMANIVTHLLSKLQKEAGISSSKQ